MGDLADSIRETRWFAPTPAQVQGWADEVEALEARTLTAEEARAVLAGTEHVTHSKQRDKYRTLLRSARTKLGVVAAGQGDE